MSKSWFDHAAPRRLVSMTDGDHAAVVVGAVVGEVLAERQPDRDVVGLVALDDDAEPAMNGVVGMRSATACRRRCCCSSVNDSAIGEHVTGEQLPNQLVRE